jgi:hypothetical protein
VKLLSPRLCFAAALAIYFGWVAALAIMASTSSTRPVAQVTTPATAPLNE